MIIWNHMSTELTGQCALFIQKKCTSIFWIIVNNANFANFSTVKCLTFQGHNKTRDDVIILYTFFSLNNSRPL